MIRLHFWEAVGITSCAKLIPLSIWALFWWEGIVFSSRLISLWSFFLWDKLHCLLLSRQNGIFLNFTSLFNISYVQKLPLFYFDRTIQENITMYKFERDLIFSYTRNCQPPGIKSTGFSKIPVHFFVYHLISLRINYLFNRNEVKIIYDEGKVRTFLNKL